MFPLFSLNPPTNETLAEMIRNIRDESLPSLHNKIDKMSDIIAKAFMEIDELKSFKDQHVGEISMMKWIGGALATFFTLILTYLSIRK